MLQFDFRVGLVFAIQRKLIERRLEVLTYLLGSSGHFESMASMEKTTPLGGLHMKVLQWYLETLRISLVSDYLTSCFSGSQGSSSVVDQSFNFEGELTTPLGGAQSLSFHRSFPKGLGCSLEASTAIGLWNQEESRLLCNIMQPEAMLLP